MMECNVQNEELIDIKLEIDYEEIADGKIYEIEKVCIVRYSICREIAANKHILIHTNDKSCFKCNFCSKFFLGVDILSDHIKTKHSTPKRYKVRYCRFCNARLYDESLVELHRIQHAKDKAQLICKVCSKVLNSRESLDMHLSMAHQVNNTYKCQDCCKSFRLKSLLKFHKQLYHIPTQVIKY